MKNTILIFSLLLLILVSACESEVKNVSIPSAEKKLVVFSFLSPELSNIEVRVTWSVPLSEASTTQTVYEPNASVMLSNGTDSIQLLYDANLKLYTIDQTFFKVDYANFYFIKVTAPNGKSVQSFCKIPSPIDTNSIYLEFDSITIPNQYGRDVIYQMKTIIADEDNIDNFYREYATLNMNTISKNNTYLMNFVLNKGYENDDGMNGDSISMGLAEYKMNFDNQIKYDYIKKYVEVFLINCDENYYKYHKSNDNYFGDNPFSEVSGVYSNILGGHGCFGAYSVCKKKIEF